MKRQAYDLITFLSSIIAHFYVSDFYRYDDDKKFFGYFIIILSNIILFVLLFSAARIFELDTLFNTKIKFSILIFIISISYPFVTYIAFDFSLFGTSTDPQRVMFRFFVDWMLLYVAVMTALFLAIYPKTHKNSK